MLAYMYLCFSDLTPFDQELDGLLPDGQVQKSRIFRRAVSEEERLIGLWARARYEAVGDHMLRLVYANGWGARQLTVHLVRFHGG